MANDLHILLRKNALEWYWSYLQRRGFVQWEQLTNDMRIRFQDRRTDFEIRQSIVARKQRPRGNFMDFYSEILDSTLSLSQPLPESEIFFILRQNMSSDLQLKLAGRRILTVPELVNQCIDIEDTWKRVNQHHDIQRKYVHELSTTTVPAVAFTGSNVTQNFGSTVSESVNHNNPYYGYVEEQVYPSLDVNAISVDRGVRQSALTRYSLPPQNLPTNSQARQGYGHRSTRVDSRLGLGTFCYGCGAPNV